MHTEKRENILQKLSEIFDKTMQSSRGPISIHHDKEFRSIVNHLLKEDGWREKFSEKFIINNLNDIIMRMVKDGDSSKAAVYLDEITQNLDSFSTEQVAYIPLFGFAKPTKEIKIGNIIIKCVEAAKANELIEKVKLAPDQIENINRHIKDHVCAEFHFVAEPDRALELAEEETRRAIDLIRYAIPATCGISRRVMVGLQGEVCRAWRYVPIDPKGAKSFAVRETVIGPLFEFEFSPENIETMKELGIFEVSEILQKEELSDFEEKLISSIHWFANSQTRTENSDKLLNLITCLEIFLSPGSGPIIQNVSEGVAMIIDDNAVDRKRTKDRISEIYSLRSSLSHHGKGEVLNLDLLELIEIDYKGAAFLN
jgi:hypothetical protein